MVLVTNMKLVRFWLVRDPSPVSVLNDIVFEMKNLNEFIAYVRGTGMKFESEHHVAYLSKEEALEDAYSRLERRDTGNVKETKMDLKQLRKIIKEEVERALGEAGPKHVGKPLPETTDEFIQMVVEALKAVNAPEDFVNNASDEDSFLSFRSDLVQTWNNIERELDAAMGEEGLDLRTSDPREVWSLIGAHLRDVVIEAVSAYNNPANFEPGHKAKKLNPEALADAVEKHVNPRLR